MGELKENRKYREEPSGFNVWETKMLEKESCQERGGKTKHLEEKKRYVVQLAGGLVGRGSYKTRGGKEKKGI